VIGWIVVVLALLAGMYGAWPSPPIRRPPGVVAPREPVVSTRDADGWRWDSSLSREDSGPGACELVWVEAVALTGG
jgi:hypothetical protein